MRDRKTNSCIIFTIIAVIAILIITGLWHISKTNIFDTTGSYTKDIAKNKSFKTYQEECEYPGYTSVIKNPEEYKNKKLKYYGLVKDIEQNTFGNITVTLRITIPNEELKDIDKSKYSHSNNEKYYYAIVKVNLKDSSDIDAYIGDNAAVYGEFSKTDEEGTIYIDGEKVIRKETQSKNN